ncbi:MAG: hypothetical protein IT385_05885 [Deltaproteobacteria bacterium]|nr:hypothetical protein [Deltaproteobacteria bacterium]
MTRFPIASLLPALGAALALACDGTDARPPDDVTGSDQNVPPELTTIETTVAPLDIPAGGTVTVSCNGKDQYGGDFPADLAFDVLDPAGRLPDGVTVVGDQVTATRAGAFQVQCYWPGPPRLPDTSPVSVNVQAGAPSEVKTSLFITQVKAGNSVSVGCSARDANGNISSVDTTVRVTPADGTSVSGRRVAFTKTGVFDVVCMTADQSIIGGDAVAVTVIPAAIYEIRTVLSSDQITPGQEVTVTCPGTDRFHNAVDLDKVITFPVDGVQGLDENRLRLTTTRAGAYPITCAPKESWVHPAVSVPATLTVLPGPAAAMTLDLAPNRQVFSLGTRVKATGKVTDAWGNAVTNLGDDVRVEGWFGGALEQTVLSGERIDLDLEGTWTLVGKVHDTSVTTSRTLIVDGSAPTIDVTFPARGQMVTSNGSALVITGAVRDATGGLKSVKLNGAVQNITVGQNELVISKSVPARHGLNTLTIEATDVNDNVTKIAQSFLVAPGWKPAVEAFADGIMVHLAKAFLDDGNRTGAANDLATIFQRFVGAIDVQSFVPSPVVTYSGFDVYLQSIDYDTPQIRMAPAFDSLVLEADILGLEADIFADGFIDVGGTVSATASRLDMQLDVSIVAGVPRVTARAAVVDVEGLDISVHWSIDWIIGLFTNTIRDSIVSSFEDILKEQVPPVLADALAAFQINQGFEIPAFLPGAAPLPVQLAARPDHTDIDEQGLDLALGTKVTAAKKVPWATAGSMMRGGCFGTDGGMPTWDASKKLTFGISLDVINQILHAVWQGGALEVQLDASFFADVDLSQYGVSDLALTLSARLPPVLTDCGGADIMLQIGELQVDASLNLAGSPLVIGLIVAFETNATVSVDESGTLGLALGDIAVDDILIDVTRLESALFDPTQEDVVVQLLKDQLLGNLLGDIAGQSLASFPIPEIDLGSIDPSLAGQKITIKQIELVRSKGYLLLQGNP